MKLCRVTHLDINPALAKSGTHLLAFVLANDPDPNNSFASYFSLTLFHWRLIETQTANPGIDQLPEHSDRELVGTGLEVGPFQLVLEALLLSL